MKLKTFREYTESNIKTVAITFGRFQPPTLGHEKLIEKLASLGEEFRIFASPKSGDRLNPIEYSDKIKILRKMFPKYGRNIIEDAAITDIFKAAAYVYKKEFTRLVVVVGDDRVAEFSKILNRYNGDKEKNTKGYFYFEDGISVVSAGERDPDSDDISGASGTKMRKLAGDNNLAEFSRGLPHSYKDRVGLFNLVRSGLGLKESYNFRKHIQLKPISERRESFVKGSFVAVGDKVTLTESKEIHEVIKLGPNFVRVKNESGKTRNAWLSSVTKI